MKGMVGKASSAENSRFRSEFEHHHLLEKPFPYCVLTLLSQRESWRGFDIITF